MGISMKGIGTGLKRRVAIAGIAGGVIVAAIPAIASAWVSWNGVDPVINLGDGHQMNITIFMQRQLGCYLEEPIDVQVTLPRTYNRARVVAESEYTWDCYEYPDNDVETETHLIIGGNNNDQNNRQGDRDGRNKTANLNVSLENPKNYPIYVQVHIDGKLAATLYPENNKNSTVSGQVSLP